MGNKINRTLRDLAFTGLILLGLSLIAIIIKVGLDLRSTRAELDASAISDDQKTAQMLKALNQAGQSESLSFSLDLDSQLVRIAADGGQSNEALIRNFLEYDDSIAFDQIKKNPARFYGKAVAMHGRIVQISESSGQTWAQVTLGTESVIPVKYNATTGFVEGDTVFIVGYWADAEPGASQAGWNTKIPALAVRKMMTLKERQQLDRDATKKASADAKLRK